MQNTILRVEGMSCEHCVKAVKTAVGSLPGVNAVSVDLREKTVSVTFDLSLTTREKIASEIEEQGYDVVK